MHNRHPVLSSLSQYPIVVNDWFRSIIGNWCGPKNDNHDKLVILEHSPPAPQTETTDTVAPPLPLPRRVICRSNKEEPATRGTSRCGKNRQDYTCLFTQTRQEVLQYHNRLLRRLFLGVLQVLFGWYQMIHQWSWSTAKLCRSNSIPCQETTGWNTLDSHGNHNVKKNCLNFPGHEH